MNNVFLWVGMLTGLFAFTSVFASDDKRVKLVSIGVMALLYWQLTAWQDRQPKDDGFGKYRVACLKKFYRDNTTSLDDIFKYDVKYLSGDDPDYQAQIVLEASNGSNIHINCLFDEITDNFKSFIVYSN
mgnify:CR=1 FL=1|tara:strand:+ start:120 stop:506 length:387 start_codon:yes stop_codon:yes gene_type:complete